MSLGSRRFFFIGVAEEVEEAEAASAVSVASRCDRGKGSYLNGRGERGREGLTRRDIRTKPLACLEDACRATGKARNMR